VGSQVEPQAGLAILGIGPVAGEAPVRQDGPDVAVEVDGVVGSGRMD
jgi:hypothetical protein